MENRLLQIYTDAKNPGSYGGVEKLHRAAVEAGLDVDRNQIREFLSSITSYSLTKPKIYNFKRSRVIATSINDLHMADLADWKHLAEFNAGYKYWLVVIDFFTKFL